MNPYQVGLNISLTGPEGGLKWLKILNTFGINAQKSHLASSETGNEQTAETADLCPSFERTLLSVS